MYEHVLSSSIYCCIAVAQAQHSTTQHSTHNTAQSARTKLQSTSRSECDNASKPTQLARANTCRAFMQHADFSKRTNEIEKTDRPIKIHNY